jgi:hypothetical protein
MDEPDFHAKNNDYNHFLVPYFARKAHYLITDRWLVMC